MASNPETAERYTLIDAEGCYGDYCYIWRSYDSLAKARAAAETGQVRIVTGCDRAEGDKVGHGPLAALIASGAWRVVS